MRYLWEGIQVNPKEWLKLSTYIMELITSAKQHQKLDETKFDCARALKRLI
jgi:thiamine biosynthesis lipoprotein ApbE